MKITYEFKFKEEATSWTYDIELDENFQVVREEVELPPWTELQSNKCDNCPLNEEENSHCPVAANIHQMVEKTKEMKSYKVALVFVKSENRTYGKETDLQDGLFSMMGLVMAASPCPHFDFLKPLTSFHMPFASIEETLFRTAGSHLLGQYLKTLNGEEAQVNLDKLKEQYAALEIVNQGLLERMRSIAKGDADKNAIVALNIFAQMFSCEFDDNFQSLAQFYKNT